MLAFAKSQSDTVMKKMNGTSLRNLLLNVSCSVCLATAQTIYEMIFMINTLKKPGGAKGASLSPEVESLSFCVAGTSAVTICGFGRTICYFIKMLLIVNKLNIISEEIARRNETYRRIEEKIGS